jgi:L-arabinose isomerase
MALEKIVHDHDLGSLAYFYSGSGLMENEESISTIILANSLLTSRVFLWQVNMKSKNVQAMKIMDCLAPVVHLQILCSGFQ